MLTELGGSHVEVQRCSLSSEGPRLRSSGAQCAQTLAVEVPAVPTACGSWRRAWRRVGKAEVDMEVEAEVVEEKEEEEKKKKEEKNNTEKTSNNPHLAGGEI